MMMHEYVTNGQKNRMISAINQYRPNLLNHNLCSNTPPTPHGTASMETVLIQTMEMELTLILTTVWQL